jgi:hypothetical protein
MGDDLSQVRGAGGTLLTRRAARWWWALLVAGLVWFLIGWVVLRADYASLTTVGLSGAEAPFVPARERRTAPEAPRARQP